MVSLRRTPKTENCEREAAPITKCLLPLFYCVVSRVAIYIVDIVIATLPRCLRHSNRQPTRRSFTNAFHSVADSLFERHSHCPTMRIHRLLLLFPGTKTTTAATIRCIRAPLQFDAADAKVLFYYVFAKSSGSSQTTVCTTASMSGPFRSIN